VLVELLFAVAAGILVPPADTAGITEQAPVPAPAHHHPSPSAREPALDWLIRKESGGRVQARNGQHFGIGQLNNNARKAQAAKLGCDPNTTVYAEQLAMMQGYIADRYGSAEAAKAFHLRKGWY